MGWYVAEKLLGDWISYITDKTKVGRKVPRFSMKHIPGKLVWTLILSYVFTPQGVRLLPSLIYLSDALFVEEPFGP